MVAGTYQFCRENPLFMEVLRCHEDQIPFPTPLKQINEIHRKGLYVPEDD